MANTSLFWPAASHLIMLTTPFNNFLYQWLHDLWRGYNAFLLLLALWLASYVIARLLTRFSIKLARRHKILSHPGPRSSHTIPTPRLGGLAIFVTWALFLLSLHFQYKGGIYRTFLVGENFLPTLMVGGSLSFLLGLYDDLKGMWPIRKLLGQCLIALIIVALGVRLHYLSLPFFGTIELGLGSVPITVFWLLFFINAFNFMDGMDGKAASFTFSSCFFSILIIFSYQHLLLSLVLLLWIASGAIAGFLTYNRPPARTFMGDGGSFFLGFLLAFIPVYLSYFTEERLPFVAFLILLMPFWYDVLYTLIRRARRGENLLQAHRSHLYQRLMLVGFSHPRILRINEILYLLCGALALVYAVSTNDGIKALAFLIAIGIMVRYTLFVTAEERKKQTT